MLISVWTNPIASFIFVERSMAKQIQDNHAYILCQDSIQRKISLKNPGFWNACLYSAGH